MFRRSLIFVLFLIFALSLYLVFKSINQGQGKNVNTSTEPVSKNLPQPSPTSTNGVSSLYIVTPEDYHLVITNKAGQRTGFDVDTKQNITEIPNSNYNYFYNEVSQLYEEEFGTQKPDSGINTLTVSAPDDELQLEIKSKKMSKDFMFVVYANHGKDNSYDRQAAVVTAPEEKTSLTFDLTIINAKVIVKQK